MPRRFAPRNDMQKHAGWGCIIPGTAGILPENAPATAVPEQISAYPSRQTPLHPRTRPSFCMSLRTSAHTGVAIRSPRRETWQGGGSLGEFVTPYEFAQSTAVFCALPRGYGLPRRFAPRHDMQKHAGWGCIIPGAAGILPENAPATAVPEQISAYPSRQTPLHPRTRPSFCMSLRTSAWGPCKGCPFAGRGAPRERCSPLAFRRRGAWRTLGRRGVAIRSPRRETWQGGGSLGEFVTPYEFAQSTAVFCALLRGYGLPRRFAPRHDMQKHAGWLHNTGRCRYTAGKRPCNRSPGASFRAPLAPNAPAPAILAPWPAVEGGPGPAKNSAPWTHRNVY